MSVRRRGSKRPTRVIKNAVRPRHRLFCSMYGLWVARVVSTFSFMPLPGNHVLRAKSIAATSVSFVVSDGPICKPLPPQGFSWADHAFPQAQEVIVHDAEKRIEGGVPRYDQGLCVNSATQEANATQDDFIVDLLPATHLPGIMALVGAENAKQSTSVVELTAALAKEEPSSSWPVHKEDIRLVPDTTPTPTTTTATAEMAPPTSAFAYILKSKSQEVESAKAQALSTASQLQHAAFRAEASEAAALAAATKAAEAEAEAAAAKAAAAAAAAKLAVVEGALTSRVEADRRADKTLAFRVERRAKSREFVSFLQTRQPAATAAPEQRDTRRDARLVGILRIARAPTEAQVAEAEAFYGAAPGTRRQQMRRPSRPTRASSPGKPSDDPPPEPETPPASERWIVRTTFDTPRPLALPPVLIPSGGKPPSDDESYDELGI